MITNKDIYFIDFMGYKFIPSEAIPSKDKGLEGKLLLHILEVSASLMSLGIEDALFKSIMMISNVVYSVYDRRVFLTQRPNHDNISELSDILSTMVNEFDPDAVIIGSTLNFINEGNTNGLTMEI